MACSRGRGVRLPLLLLTPLSCVPPTPLLCQRQAHPLKTGSVPWISQQRGQQYCYSLSQEIQAQGSRVCSSVRGGGGRGSPLGRFPGVGGWGLTGEGRREARPVHSSVLFTKLLRSLYIRSRLRSVRQAVGAGGCQSSSLTCVFHL